MYVTATLNTVPLMATISPNMLYITETFEFTPMPTGGYSWQTEVNLNYVSATALAGGPLYAARRSPSTWETFSIKYLNQDKGPTAAGVEVAISNLGNNMYLTVMPNGEIWPNSATIGDAQTFYLVDADAYSAMWTGN
jgi:hypothetical protein